MTLIRDGSDENVQTNASRLSLSLSLSRSLTLSLSLSLSLSLIINKHNNSSKAELQELGEIYKIRNTKKAAWQRGQSSELKNEFT